MSTPRKKYKPRPVSLHPVQIAADAAAYLTLAEIEANASGVDAAVSAIKAATARREHWQALFDALNLIEAFGQMGKKLMPVWREWHSSAQELCVTITDRRKGGVMALRAEEIKLLQSVADTWREIMTQTTRGQYRQAIDAAERKIRQALMRRDDKITRIDCEHGTLRRS